MQNEPKVLWLFNLATDLDNNLLTVSHAWINEFSKHFERIEVYSTHVGRFQLPVNVNVNEIGGGSFHNRVLGLFTVLKAWQRIHKERNRSIVFHHMSPRTAAILALPLKISSVEQSLWYSHLHTAFSLRIGKWFVKNVFTASEMSIRLSTKNISYVRNAVPTEKFEDINLNNPRIGLVSLGRVAPVKRLEMMLEAIGSLDTNNLIKLENASIIGPGDSEGSYIRKLKQMASNKNFKIRFYGPIPNDEIPVYLASASIYFTGTLGGIDKAAIEAGLCGCFVVSDNKEALRLVGMERIYSALGITGDLTVAEQIELILQNPNFNLQRRKELHDFGMANNSLEMLVSRIVQIMDKKE